MEGTSDSRDIYGVELTRFCVTESKIVISSLEGHGNFGQGTSCEVKGWMCSVQGSVTVTLSVMSLSMIIQMIAIEL